jgi:hypothetical protein
VTGPDTPRRGRRQLLLRWGLPALGLVIAVLLVVWLLPGSDDDGGSSAAASASGGTAPTEEQQATSTVAPSPATEVPAASLVAREGVPESARTVEVSAADFAAPAEWADGATVRVTAARQQVTSGTGPGELSGQPQTVFTLELTNGSDAALDVNAVVVQVAYGAGRTQASPLYDSETADFGGTVEPGGTTTAIYSFAIPADQLGDVVLSVDVDGYRFPAVLSGAVPVD